MSKEIRVPHDESDTPQNYTRKMERIFAENFGGDPRALHLRDVEALEDDWKKKERILKVKTTKYIVMGK